MEGEATQLSDSRPQIDTPLRVQIPLNTPSRISSKTRDDFIQNNAFSPAALSFNKTVSNALPTKKLAPIKELPSGAVNMDHDAQVKTAIRDFSMLAFSSSRAGKRDVAATAYVSLAIIYDNQGNFVQGIECYKQYLTICVESGDVNGQGVAYNCLAVNHMLMASPPSDAGSLTAVLDSNSAKHHLSLAIDFHEKHLAVADSGGSFVAHTNLGLCHGMMGDSTDASKSHQDALRIAIKMQTLYGQSIAVGNLGMLGMLKKDFATARTCFEQHLQLVQALFDPEAEVNAWKLLAKLHHNEGNFSDALENLEQAKRVATQEGYRNELKRILCLIGISKGSIDFDDFAQSLISALK